MHIGRTLKRGDQILMTRKSKHAFAGNVLKRRNYSISAHLAQNQIEQGQRQRSEELAFFGEVRLRNFWAHNCKFDWLANRLHWGVCAEAVGAEYLFITRNERAVLIWALCSQQSPRTSDNRAVRRRVISGEIILIAFFAPSPRGPTPEGI